MKSLNTIKDEVCQEWGHADWNDFGESFKHRLGSAHAERDEVMTEIAKRYALEVAKETQRRCANRGLFHRTYNDVDDTPMLLQRQVLHKNNIPELI